MRRSWRASRSDQRHSGRGTRTPDESITYGTRQSGVRGVPRGRTIGLVTMGFVLADGIDASAATLEGARLDAAAVTLVLSNVATGTAAEPK
jgi:hypothetical protein